MRQFPFVEQKSSSTLRSFVFLRQKSSFSNGSYFFLLFMLPRAGTTACKETSLVVALVDIMDFDLLFFIYYGTVFESHFEKVPIFAPTTFKKDNFVDFYKR